MDVTLYLVMRNTGTNEKSFRPAPSVYGAEDYEIGAVVNGFEIESYGSFEDCKKIAEASNATLPKISFEEWLA